jgi:hypothetical protein
MMNRRTFLISSSLSLLTSLSLFTAKPHNLTKAKLQASPEQNILKLTYMPPCGETLGSILVRSPINKTITDIDIKSLTVENLPNDIQEIVKNLKQQNPQSRFVFEKSTMVYKRDEYDQLAETTLENLFKPSGQSRREYGESISKPS